jgi:ribosomal protein S3
MEINFVEAINEVRIKRQQKDCLFRIIDKNKKKFVCGRAGGRIDKLCKEKKCQFFRHF